MPPQLTFAGHSLRLLDLLGTGATSSAWAVETAEGPAVLKVGRAAGEGPRLADEATRLLFAECPEFPRLLAAGLLGPAHQAEPRLGADAATPCLLLSRAAGDALEQCAVDPAERSALALGVAHDLGAALDALHGAGLAHGDIKPSNVIVARSGDAFRARLVDFGLSGPSSAAQAIGGTRRYLAPEVFRAEEGGDARARDLWALGLTLYEIVRPELRAQAAPVEFFSNRPPLTEAREPIAVIVRALMSPVPGARPSARWVLRQAERALGERPASDVIERRRAAVRRAYLSVRRAEIDRAGRARARSIALAGPAAEWLERACALSAGIAQLRGARASEEALHVSELDVRARARFLVALVGFSAAAWPTLSQLSEGKLLDRLLALCAELEPESISFSQLEGAGTFTPSAPIASQLDLALALRPAMPDSASLDSGEALLRREQGPLALALLLARKLRLRGEMGRALSLLASFDGLAARLESAELSRRAGDPEGAERLLANVAQADCSAEQAARLVAIRARLALDAGHAEAARKLLAASSAHASLWEVRALVELSCGSREAAEDAAGRARLFANDDEERARVEGVLGLLADAASDAEGALRAFRSAADFAARAGAVREEATYLTGLGAAAWHVGDYGAALEAAQRSAILFECLGRGLEAARALITVANVQASLGNALEASASASDAAQRAKLAGDNRCRGYAHLILADVAERPEDALEQARRAETLLGQSDALLVAARLLASGGDPDQARFDELAHVSESSAEGRLAWWGARAMVAVTLDSPGRAEHVLSELVLLASSSAALSVRGKALQAGALLAARVGDADLARRLTFAAGDAARELTRRVGPELSARVRGLAWVRGLDVRVEDQILPEQIDDVETLVRGLGQRDRLRPLLRQVVDALVLWTGVERGLLLLRAPGGKLKPRAARNIQRVDLTREQLALSQSLAERALRLGEPVVAVDAAGDLPEIHESVHALKLRSVLAVPLVARGEALGVVYLDDRVRRGAFGPRELAWVRLVGTLAAVAIADARDQLLLRRAARRAERAEQHLEQQLAKAELELDVTARELARTRDARETRFAYDAIVGSSEAVRALLKLVDRVTTSDVPVLILGESGSGKELVARAIHANGARARARFVTENCSAIPEGLLESTLFGHVRGAFTGAARPRAGLFEIAHRGTLFLDEVADMSLAMQTKLLRVLEDGSVRPVGAEAERKVDVRVLAATHHDVAALVAAGKFREDLYYRLNVISLHVPALRERYGDIPLLVKHFVECYAGKRRITVARSAMDALCAYPWPGNVRQLENEIRRALVMADDTITLEQLTPEVARGRGVGGRSGGLNLRERVDALEVELVQSALRRTEGNQTRAAEILGLSRFGLQKMMKRLEIS
ncbi:MAG TPA: sigma 54-interacting transcriptional regulator [Polyangiaceae bacterium]|jgi:transcriptional regulator with GAF, ATPase, and Fis domain